MSFLQVLVTGVSENNSRTTKYNDGQLSIIEHQNIIRIRRIVLVLAQNEFYIYFI